MLPTHPRIPKEDQTITSDLRPIHLATLNTDREVVVSAVCNLVCQWEQQFLTP